MRIHEFNLVYREKFDLRFSLVKFDFAGDANDFPCERSDPPVSRNFCPGFNEPSEHLIGVISSEVDQYGPEWASPDGDDEPAHLDVFAYVVNGFRLFEPASSQVWWVFCLEGLQGSSWVFMLLTEPAANNQSDTRGGTREALFGPTAFQFRSMRRWPHGCSAELADQQSICASQLP